MVDAGRACTPACTLDTKESSLPKIAGIEHTFAEAIAQITKLPLTEAEKAEAVRRLMRTHHAG